MKWLNCKEMKVLLVGFMVAIVLSGGSVKADYAWTRKADMPTPRSTQTSAVVNGKIYVIGGATSEPDCYALSTVEEYDPVTDTWTRKADMPTARCDFVGSSAVVDGKIYVMGGDIWDGGWITISTVEEYDPATDTWTRKSDMPTARWCLGTCTFDEKIYAIGGYPAVGYTALTTVEVYDPVYDTWTSKSDMPLNRGMLSASVVNGKIYAVGGRPRLHAEPSVQEYDPSTDTWTQKSDMPVATSQMGSLVFDNKIVVIGGWEISTKYPYTTVQVYDTVTDTWILEEDVPFLRACFTAEVVNNRIYVIGGTDRPHPCPSLSTVYEFGPLVDFNADGLVNINDLLLMIDNWGTNESLCDIGPTPLGDGVVDEVDLEVLMSYWGQEILPLELITYWKLDETEGTIAYDSAGEYNGTLNGEPLWRPDDGIVNGAIELDGIDDYVSTPCILPSLPEAFSIFVWVKGGLPGQVIVSQQTSTNWLMLDQITGCLMTELKASGRSPALVSQTAITGGFWHRIGFVWDGTNRVLYVDDIEVASDTQDSIFCSNGEMYIGAGNVLAPGTFFSGLIDDVRIYNRAITP
jgi:N-acetylneuraminic acid mutarotase